jgi:hypothetical protein
LARVWIDIVEGKVENYNAIEGGARRKLREKMAAKSSSTTGEKDSAAARDLEWL